MGIRSFFGLGAAISRRKRRSKAEAEMAKKKAPKEPEKPKEETSGYPG